MNNTQYTTTVINNIRDHTFLFFGSVVLDTFSWAIGERMRMLNMIVVCRSVSTWVTVLSGSSRIKSV
jgi:hypothetical protein